MPLVSVIMPAYNASKYIVESITSIQQQTFTDWELIVIDDESSDDTAEVVKKMALADNRIIYGWQKNGKQGKARNKAISFANGKYLAFLDADDVWLPEKLSHQVTMIEENEVDLVFAYSYEINSSERTEIVRGRGHGLYSGKEAVDFLILYDAFLMSTVMVKTEIAKAVSGFEEDLRIQYCEDWNFWLKLALSGYSFYTDSNVVAYYRLHDASSASTEDSANVKFFYALWLLRNKFPEHAILVNETRKRAINLIYHQSTITKSLVIDICDCVLTKSSILTVVYQIIFAINANAFRKVFLFFHNKSK